MIYSLLSFLYRLYQKHDQQRFLEALKNPKGAQHKVFAIMLKEFNQSFYGQQFGPITSLEQYQKKVPIITYEDIRALIDQQRQKGTPLLTKDLPKTYEFTSGSSGTPKPIAYNQALMNHFQRMFRLWSYDILSHAPFKLKNGTFYFSVSPLRDQHQGLEDDRDYLSGLTRIIFSPFWIGHQLKGLKNPKDYLQALTICLTYHSKLEVLSFWSPSLFLSAIDYLEKNRYEIIDILNRGHYHVPGVDLKFKGRHLKIDSPLKDFFPNLRFVSCWSDGQAKVDFKQLKRLFPQVYFQGKGLLATEAPLTIPLVHSPYPVPLVDALFYEFKNAQDEVFTLDQIKVGETYQIIFSHSGGLYRYSLGDLVLVHPSYLGTPTFEFLSRQGIVSDLCGEKFSEYELRGLLGLESSSFAIFPEERGYLVFGPQKFNQEWVEQKLQNSPHYHYARIAQQLRPIRYFSCENLGQAISEYLHQFKQMRPGDIKLQLLYPQISDHKLKEYLLKRSFNES